MQINKNSIVFPELSYEIVGAAFQVFNNLGWGLSEIYYGRALAKELDARKIRYQKEARIPLEYKNQSIGNFFADFLIEDKVILELKVVSKLGYANVRQVLGYLQNSGIKLGILLYFTKDGVKYRRVLNSRA